MSLAPVTFADLILHHALTQPEKPALVLADRVVTYGMAAQGMLRVERRLRELKLPAGALVCVTLESPIRHMLVAAALFRLGHPAMSASSPASVITLALPVAAYLEGPGAPLIPGQRQVTVTDDWFAGEPESFSPLPAGGYADDDAICRVELSSGTTGRPKAVSLTLGAFNQWLVNYSHSVGQGYWDRMLSLPGLTNSWGFSLAAHVLNRGKTLVFADTPRDTLQMIALYQADMLVASTQQLRELVREQTNSPIPCPSLRAIMTGGSLLAPALMTDARAKLCSNIVCQYGSTEAGATAFATVDKLVAIEGATGYVAPWAIVQTVDENELPLPPDTEGNLRIRATCQGDAYPPGRPDAQSTFRDGWFYPGDRGRVRADGLLIVTGRGSEIINFGGLKIAPEIIEDLLAGHPSVQEAAAFSARGEGGIEEIVLAIVPRGPLDDQQLINWCAARNIPVAKIFFVETLPKTTLGKFNRELLRQQLLG
ncbi:MAG TPA: class I adenylate-forming enzyme family protein [Xanthobacteraceae bacterium]|jgi:acyl-coenzyme A synthetase/AMP-(fatty) acid ligase